MKQVTLYRSDFKLNPDDGDSFFDLVLESLGVPKKDWENIQSVVMDVGLFQCED